VDKQAVYNRLPTVPGSPQRKKWFLYPDLVYSEFPVKNSNPLQFNFHKNGKPAKEDFL